MALKGDLASVDLAQVFQMLALNQKVGLLCIQSPDAWKALYFDERGVTLYFNEHTTLDRVVFSMCRTGFLAEDGVSEARQHAARNGQTFTEVLLAGGYMTEEDLDNGIRTVLEEEIYELFFWRDAKFEFHEGATSYDQQEGVIGERFFFSTDMLIMEAARRIDEWGHIKSVVPTGLEIHRHVNGSEQAFNMDDEHLQVFEFVDGCRNVERIVEMTGHPPFHVYKCLASMLDARFIEPLPLRSLIPSGQDCANEGRLQDAVNLFEKAVTEEEGLPEVHTMLAEAYDAIGEYELSAYHTKCMAEYHAARGNVREAIDLFHWVLESIPTDLAARQRVVELSVGQDDLATDDFDPLRVGKDLVDLYLEIGEIERVRSILEDLLREHPHDLELKKSLINVHTKAGDVKRVVELYESIAADLAKQGDPIQAIKYLQKILQIDRGRLDISERIKQLYRADERRRSRRRSLVGLGMMFMMLVLAGVGYLFYDQHARDRFESMDLKSLIDQRDYGGAMRAIKQFQSSFPFTTAAKDAEAELRDLQAQQTAHQAELQAQEDAVLHRINGLRTRYRGLWAKFQELSGKKQFARALVQLDEVLDLLRKTGQAQDVAWEQKHKVKRTYEELKRYLGEAASLERKARRALDDGDWQVARVHLLKLLNGYGFSDQAQDVLVPVRFDSRPRGAQIIRDGKPLSMQREGKSVPVTTPAVVFCKAADKLDFELRREGFEGKPLVVKPLEQDSVVAVMTIVPETMTGLQRSAISSPGVGNGGGLAVGLQGGFVGLGILNGGGGFRAQALGGLSELSGQPAVTSAEAVFATNEGEMLCYSLREGQRRWKIKLSFPLEFDPVIENGRVFLVDRESRVQALSVSSGRVLWTEKFAGRVSGPVTVRGRNVALGTQAGEVLLFDAANGKRRGRIADLPGISTQVLQTRSMLVFGTEDGKLHGHNLDQGGRRIWSHDLSRAARERELRFAADGGKSVYVIAAGSSIKRVRLADGEVLSSRSFPHRLRADLAVGKGGVYVILREKIPVDNPTRTVEEQFRYRDLLLCLDPEDLGIEWEFRDEGDFRGQLVCSEQGELLVTGAEGEVYRFK